MRLRPRFAKFEGFAPKFNTFIARPFWRFATMCDFKTELPAGVDAHKAISLVTMSYFARQVSRCDVDVVALIFEGSDRGDSLVRHDYDLATMDLKNMWGRRVEVEGCFMSKGSIEPGLEVADVIAHTAGRQRRHEMLETLRTAEPCLELHSWHTTSPNSQPELARDNPLHREPCPARALRS